jgi:hypothetical protein
MPTTTVPQVRFRTIDGLRIRYADSGPAREPTLLLTSPWPESVYAFTPMWSTLAEQARLFATKRTQSSCFAFRWCVTPRVRACTS